MNRDVFWQMIDDVREKCGDNRDLMEQELTDTLYHMSPQEIIKYKVIEYAYKEMANTDEIYAAGSDLSGHEFYDDHFLDFRSYLVAQGKDAYMNVVSNPDSLESLGLKPDEDGLYEWESFAYVASDAYEEKAGEEMPQLEREMIDIQKEEIAAEIAEYSQERDMGGMDLC
jgi:hypothetical protein